MIRTNEITSKIPFDISVEALAATLMDCFDEDFFSVEQFLIAPKGHLTRTIHKEVEYVSDPFYDNDDLQYLNLEINREGLYDTLPAHVFIEVDTKLETNSEKAIQIAKQVAAARNFFLPFEQILYQTRIDVELKEREAGEKPELYLRLLFNDIVKLEKDCEALGEKILERRRRILSYTLPHLDAILSDDNLKMKVLSGLLGKKLTIRHHPPQWISIPEEWQSSLSDGINLGADVILGKAFKDGVSKIELEIELEDVAETHLWLPSCPERNYFDKIIYPTFFAADEDFEFNIKIPEHKRVYTLSEEANTLFVGYSVYL
jgi:Type VI secretion, TssG